MTNYEIEIKFQEIIKETKGVGNAEALALRKTYRANGGSKHGLCTKADIIAIQTEQLGRWKKVLKSKVHKALVEYATEDNDTIENPYRIVRGQDLDIFVVNY